MGVEANFWAGQIQTRYKRTAPDVRLYGETPGSLPARNWNVQDGRGIADTDVDGARDVCVLGNSLARTIFPTSSVVGERVKINGMNYTVIGVLYPKGGKLGGDQDNFAIIPLTTGLNRFGHTWRSLTLLVQARDRATFDACLEEVRGLLRIIRKVPPGEPDSFDISSNDTLIAQFRKFTRTLRLGVAVVSSIALLAAGIGIMNIMLVSVTERTREIGIRRAVGAKKRNIMTQFIIEAIVLCEIGGVDRGGVRHPRREYRPPTSSSWTRSSPSTGSSWACSSARWSASSLEPTPPSKRPTWTRSNRCATNRRL